MPSSPLLRTQRGAKVISDFHGCSRLSFKEVIVEMKMLYTIAFPMIITGLLTYGKSFISMLFLGNLGKDALAGGSLAIAIANISGYSILYGLSLGMEPISSQAFGAKQWPLLSQTLYRTLLLLSLSCIPISILWLNIHPFLLFFKLDSSISAAAVPYLAFSLPSLLFQSLINPLKIYLRAQNIISPIMSSAIVALAFHVPTAYLLVAHLRLGVPGVALASAAADLAQLTTLLSHVENLSSLGGGGATATAKEWQALLKLALPSCAAVCLEWWWYEIMILLAGVLPDAAEAVACMGILTQATSLAYVFPSALGLAASVRVGNELGAGQPGRARGASLVAVACAAATSLATSSSMLAVAGAWGRAFTDDKAVAALTAALMPVVGLCELGNYPQTTGCGVLRGSARVSLSAHINVGSFYGVGLPLAIWMGFVLEMGLLGLWLGLLGTQIVCALLMAWILGTTDWVVESHRARQLIGMEFEDQGLASIKTLS
ncbi:protein DETOXIFICATION 51-like [Salvia hispanica]|uniref:protein DETOXIFICATION 51-like n=1 Tax=Salvia hispanica TaxID=49212 RepID=UPI0020099CCA|nr:protein DETOXIFICATION 51-like [Salvia hispanica]